MQTGKTSGSPCGTDPVIPPDEPGVPAGPSVQAEFLVGWRLPEGAERAEPLPAAH